MQATGIEWTDYTSSPLKYRDPATNKVVWGCAKTSAGCSHCYSEAIARRFDRGGPFNLATVEQLHVFVDESEVRTLLRSKKLAGKRVFLDDMTDLFGEWVPDELIDQHFALCALRPDVTFQVLTKRAERMANYFNTTGRHGSWGQPAYEMAKAMGWASMPQDQQWLPVGERIVHPPLANVWLGVSVENQQAADERIPHLLRTPAAVRFLSCEPLLWPVDLTGWIGAGCPTDAESLVLRETFPDGIPANSLNSRWAAEQYEARRNLWVIAGAESGPGARPCNLDWVRSLRDQCQDAKVPFFFKQHVEGGRKISLPELDGRQWAEFPQREESR